MEPVRAAPAPNPSLPRARAAAGGFAVALATAQDEAPRARGVALSGVGRPWQSVPNGEFRQRIAQAERSAEHAQDGYTQRNPRSGALGRYQFLPNTLFDLGWKRADGSWTALAERHNIRSEADFLANPAAQEAAMSQFLRRVEIQLERNGALTRQGTQVQALNGETITLTEGAMVAAAHRRGAGTLARYLAHRTTTPDAPLTPRERNAFQAVERRLQDFIPIAYASMRTPTPRSLAATATPPTS